MEYADGLFAVNSLNGHKVEISANSDKCCASAFKVIHDNARGNMVYVRTFAGTLHAKQIIQNSSRNVKERSNQLLKVSPDDYTSVSSLGPGQVYYRSKEYSCWGEISDTLVTDKGPLHSFTVPKPVFSLSIEPEKTKVL